MKPRKTSTVKVVIKRVFLAGTVAVIGGAIIVVVFFGSNFREYRLTRRTEEIRASLGKYHTAHKAYPDSLAAVGIPEKEEGPIYYQRDSTTSHEL